jgi:transcriptional regulator with XRE-family HTH domain
MLACGIVSRLTFGVICDRIGGLRTLLLGSALQGLALLMFLPFDGLVSLYVISALFGLFQGGIVPAYAIIVRDAFRDGARRMDVRRDLRPHRLVQGGVRERHPVQPREPDDRPVAAAPRDAAPRARVETLRGRGGGGHRFVVMLAPSVHPQSEAVMATSRKRATKRTRAGAGAPRGSAAAPAPQESALEGVESALVGVAKQVRSWSDSVLGIAGAAADVSIGAAKAILVRPDQRAALAKAGTVLRGMREAAGLSVKEVGEAINLKDPTLLELVENGKVALPFEIILRLASVLGRNDPISFVMRFTRSYNPDVWHTLENLGIGRFAVQAGREREFANIYRGSDAARRLTDEDFGAVLAFTKAAFEMALAFRGTKPSPARTAPRKQGAAAK